MLHPKKTGGNNKKQMPQTYAECCKELHNFVVLPVVVVFSQSNLTGGCVHGCGFIVECTRESSQKKERKKPPKKNKYTYHGFYSDMCVRVCAECVRVCACVCIGFYELLLLLLLLLFLFQLRPALTSYLLPRYNSCGKRYPQDTWCEGLRERNCDALNIIKG